MPCRANIESNHLLDQECPNFFPIRPYLFMIAKIRKNACRGKIIGRLETVCDMVFGEAACKDAIPIYFCIFALYNNVPS